MALVGSHPVTERRCYREKEVLEKHAEQRLLCIEQPGPGFVLGKAQRSRKIE